MIASTLPFAISRGNDPTEGESTALLPWWSITKTVLAVAALRLADQRRIDLDNFYREKPFTIRQLLQHTAGLNSYGGARYFAAVAAGDPVWPVAELFERRNVEKLIFAPGEGWAYSNIGYIFIRRLIEDTTGLELDAALRQLVFGPLGIFRTRIAATPADMAATLWGNDDGYDPRWVYHGLLIGPPSDAVDFLRRLFAGSFLSEGARASMRAFWPLGESLAGRPWTRTGYGLGLMMGEMGEAGRVYGHSGVGHDNVSALYCFPQLAGKPIVAVFAQGADEGVAEFEAARLACSTALTAPRAEVLASQF